MWIPIRWKLILSIGLPLLAVYGVVLRVDYLGAADRILGDRKARVVEVSLRQATRFDAMFASAAQAGRTVATALALSPKWDDGTIQNLLGEVVRDNANVYGIGVAFAPSDGSGTLPRLRAPYACRTAEGVKRFDIAHSYDYTRPLWDWYAVPVKTGEATWTEPYFDADAGNALVCTYARPVMLDGRVAAVVKVDVRLDTLRETLREAVATTTAPVEAGAGGMPGRGGGFAIVSRNGTFISYPDPKYILRETIFTLAERIGRPALAEVGKAMLAGQAGAERIDGFADEGPVWFFFSPIASTGWSFVAMAPERGFMEPAYAQLQLSSAILLSGLVVILGVVLMAAFRITSPLEKMHTAVQRLAGGDLEARVEGVRHRDELGELAGAFNRMVDDLRAGVARWTEEHAAREAVEHDLRTARHIQKSLLPKSLVDPAGRFVLDAMNVPAKHVAGDFYDFFLVEDGRLMVCVGDVSGKGVPAALLMAVTRTLIRDLARPGRTPGQILDRANISLLSTNAGGMFVTVFLGLYDIADGTLHYASAAHPLAHCLRPSALIDGFTEATGTVLGILPDQTFEDRRTRLEVGDRLIIYTDGFPEARTPEGEFLGDDRFVAMLRGNAGLAPDEFCRRVIDEVLDFQRREIRDDITMVLLQRNA